MQVKISGGPVASGMTVTGQNDQPIAGITRLVIDPIIAGQEITAKIDVNIEAVDIAAEAMLSLESVTAAAAFYGFALVPFAAPEVQP